MLAIVVARREGRALWYVSPPPRCLLRIRRFRSFWRNYTSKKIVGNDKKKKKTFRCLRPIREIFLRSGTACRVTLIKDTFFFSISITTNTNVILKSVQNVYLYVSHRKNKKKKYLSTMVLKLSVNTIKSLLLHIITRVD